MKKYRVKIGNLYIHNLYTDSELIKTNFVREIELRTNTNKFDFKVEENEQEKIRNLLSKILRLENEYNEVTFEEVEDSNE